MSRMFPLLSIDAIAAKAAVSSFLRTHAVRTNCVGERPGVWGVLGFVVPLKERISASRLKPTPYQWPRVVSMCATRWHFVSGCCGVGGPRLGI